MRTFVHRDLESCSYAGMSYANPHAVTSVGGTSYTYDNNGNVTAIGSLDYIWDWRNRLASAERSGGGIISYGYDHTGQRVFQATGSATTSYPNRYYNVASSSLTATTTKHIFSPDGTLLATVVGASTTASTTYLHSDHLGGTNVATNEDGEVVQTLDYYPYGSQRVAAGAFSEQRRFIGEEFDGDTEFSYLNARYYQGTRGQFMSQDPASRDNPGQFLADPQQLNSYAYSKNNPLRFLDKSGEVTIEFSRPLAHRVVGRVASHNAIAGYNVPGFPKGIMTFGGYDSGGPAAYNRLVMDVARAGDNPLSRDDFEIAQQIFAGDISGARGFTLIKDFGGLTEEEYWKKLIDAGVRINLQGVPYSVTSQNSHSGLNTSKNYANPNSSFYQPTHPWLGLPWLTPASENNVLQRSQSGSGSSGSSAFGLSAGTEIGSSNVGAFVTFIKQFF